MQQPHKWIWGLIPAALLWVLASMFQTGHIERDLTAKTGTVITAKEIVDSGISVAGRDVTINGLRFAGDGADLTKAVETLDGVRLVRNATKLVDEAKPYRWSLIRDGAKVTLGGNVPSPVLRGTITNAAKVALPDTQVSDSMTYARGAAGELEKLVGFAFAPMASLSKGSAEIVDGVLSISGEAATGDAYRKTLAAIEAIPAALKGKMDIQPPTAKPYTFTAEKMPGSLVLTGFYPDEKTHKGILAQAKRLFFGVEITDKMQEAQGAPVNFSNAAAFALSQLARMENGVASLIDQAYKLSGKALYDKAVEQMNNAIKFDLPQGFTGVSEVGVKAVEKELDAATCQALMTGLLGKGRILFETGGARISADSAGLLDSLAFSARSCPAARIEVSGHTDSDGDDTANLNLSQRRAESVVNYLRTAGIAEDRIHAVGYGETRPIASNDTDEGKALNRRIEFTIQ